MHVGLVAPPWLPVPPPAYGGSEVVVDGLARGLMAAGHDVLLVAPGDSTCPVPTIASPCRADPSHMGAEMTALAHVTRAYAALGAAGVDVIHDHTLAGVTHRYRPESIPVVVTHHGPFDADARDLFRAAAGDIAVVAISADQAATAADVPIARVIHHGIDVASVPIGAGDGGYVAFLGRMSPQKGVREAILAARSVGVPIRVGAKMAEPGEYEYYRSEVAPLLGGDVEFLGEVVGQDKFALLGGAMALVNPVQWHEPFGLVMIEALACGTPVVATAAGSAPELVCDGVTGRLCRTRPEMTSALREVVRDPGRLDRSACRRDVEQRFDVGRMVRDYAELYTELIAGPKR
jgi:glycosyltransferase involved in cell wall biosynthesis